MNLGIRPILSQQSRMAKINQDQPQPQTQAQPTVQTANKNVSFGIKFTMNKVDFTYVFGERGYSDGSDLNYFVNKFVSTFDKALKSVNKGIDKKFIENKPLGVNFSDYAQNGYNNIKEYFKYQVPYLNDCISELESNGMQKMLQEKNIKMIDLDEELAQLLKKNYKKELKDFTIKDLIDDYDNCELPLVFSSSYRGSCLNISGVNFNNKYQTHDDYISYLKNDDIFYDNIKTITDNQIKGFYKYVGSDEFKLPGLFNELYDKVEKMSADIKNVEDCYYEQLPETSYSYIS